MNYIPFDEYKRKWIFTHQSMPVEEADKEAIKPMSTQRSSQLWTEFVSRKSPTVDHFGAEDWANKDATWKEEVNWMIAWEDEADLPPEFIEHFQWEDNIVVYFCYDKTNIIETRWAMFKKYWKNFLFYDDKPLLLGRRKQEVAMFEQSGEVKVGKRP
ncbi:hypothetical protein CS022_05500 [Veronia nyctiphanis]|uniref:DUF2947 domain-containing protein n=1 Tax=Veronia nyctiphanis TaxID=1278244 RepID=A0A4Q0YSA1_9GAMM|nr:DUF2947 domain-containing protein [Veronia nyctiphanis]RXJ74090.1 hypothetical protein CS022_05500 [Veronia nyctiphanis]